MDEANKELLRQRQAQISSVMQHPGWPAWVAEAERKIEKMRVRARTEALSPAGANQRELDYIRGWIDALHYTYRMPQSAEGNLAKFMEQLEADDA